MLRIELTELSNLELNFDLEITGFETAQIDFLIEGTSEEDEDDPADHLPDLPEDEHAVTQSGDIWLLGNHRLICGDSTKTEAYQALMQGDKAQMVFTDPPYNVPVDGHVCGSGKIKHREFAMASGEMTESQFIGFLKQFIQHSIAFSKNGSLHYIFMDWRHTRYRLLLMAA